MQRIATRADMSDIAARAGFFKRNRAMVPSPRPGEPLEAPLHRRCAGEIEAQDQLLALARAVRRGEEDAFLEGEGEAWRTGLPGFTIGQDKHGDTPGLGEAHANRWMQVKADFSAGCGCAGEIPFEPVLALEHVAIRRQRDTALVRDAESGCIAVMVHAKAQWARALDPDCARPAQHDGAKPADQPARHEAAPD